MRRPTAIPFQALAIDSMSPAVLYAGTYEGAIFKTTDGSETWSVVNGGLDLNDVIAIVIDRLTPPTVYAATGGVTGVFKSTNGGTTWIAVNNGLIGNRNVRALAIDATTQIPFLRLALNQGLTHLSIYTLGIDQTPPTSIYAGTGGGGVFKMSLVGPTLGVRKVGTGAGAVSSLPAGIDCGDAVGRAIRQPHRRP